MTRPDITLIGAGLVGSLCALMLARRGYRVEVFEQLPDIRKESIAAGRSINLALANRGIYPLQQAGVMDEVEKLLIPMRGRMLHDKGANLQFQPYGQRPEEVIYSVSRAGLVSLLRDAAEATGKVQFHFRHPLASIDFDRQIVTVENLLTGISTTHDYDILLGCDGANSRVRRALEQEVDGDFSAELLSHSYKELNIPAGDKQSFRIEKEALHIWPRGGYMLIALPNLDGSFTVTLFLPNSGEPGFSELDSEQAVTDFFETQFPDASALIPDLAKTFFTNPTGVLGTVRCQPWYHKKALILGDAAHAIVPFHGQGMNCGFEDCAELDTCLDEFDEDWDKVMVAFTARRKENADAIADMALENYVEMRDSVNDPKWQLKKQLAFELERRHPDRFIPRYSMVMFHRMPYAVAQRRGKIQSEILEALTADIDSVADHDSSNAEKLIEERLPPLH